MVVPMAVCRAAGRKPGAHINSSQHSPKNCSKDYGQLKGICADRAAEILGELCPEGGDLKNLWAFLVFVLPKDIVVRVIVASECIL